MRLVLVAIVAAACGHPHAPPPPAPPAIAGLGDLIAPGATLVLGEVHGTAESPRFLGDVALAAAARAPTTVALEIPRDEQARVDAFVGGGPRDALLAGRFWRRAMQDGRSSVAILGLLDRVRAARASGTALDVLAYDVPAGDTGDGQARDRAMAARVVEARRAAPARTFVVYGGNIHSRRAIGTPWDASYHPMTWAIADAGIALITLDVRSSGGGAWVCLMGDDGKPLPCGVHASRLAPSPRSWYVEIGAVDGHDGVYVIGPTTASPPAAPAGSGSGP